MAKKLGKILLTLTTAAAAGAGIYYLLKKKNEEPEDEFDESFDDADDFELDEISAKYRKEDTFH